MGVETRQYFSYDKSKERLMYLGSPIGQKQIDEAKKLLVSHVMPGDLGDRRSFINTILYESLIFCIVSQGLTYERVLKFMDKIHSENLQTISDATKVHSLATTGINRLRWAENRFAPIFDYIAQTGGIDAVAQRLLDQPGLEREAIVDNSKFMAMKTTSFWYLALGGEKEIMTLDVHVMRQLAPFIEGITPSHYEGKLRLTGKSAGKNIVTQPSTSEYLRTEQNAVIFLNKIGFTTAHSDFMNDFGTLNGSLMTALLWGAGAYGARNNPRQSNLFENKQTLTFESPYRLK